MRRISFVLCAAAAAALTVVACSGPAETEPPRTSKALRLIDLSFTDGAYQVGTELQPGTYRTQGSATQGFPSCNWKRFRAGGQGGLVATGSSTGPTTITIDPTDGAFESRGCQPWVRQ